MPPIVCTASVLLVLAFSATAAGADGVAGELIVFDDDGAWCWFQDERAIVHDGKLWIGTVASGTRDPQRRGDVQVIVYDLGTGTAARVELHDRLECDDHDDPALLALPDGRVLAVYSRHGSDSLIRKRVTGSAGDPLQWEPEQTIPVTLQRGHGVTYSNVYRLAAENEGHGRIYDFFRGEDWDPSVAISDDDGASWSFVGRLVGGPGRPYVRYASNHVDAIHFVCTDQHPRDHDNSLYHGFVRNDRIHGSGGTAIGEPGNEPVTHDRLTRIFQGDPDNVAWCSDLELSGDGHPHVVYSVQKDSAGLPPGQGGDDCRYRYAWWDGERWIDHEVGHAGRRLYPREDDYTGLISLDPSDVRTVYLSTDAHPATGAPLISRGDGQRHHEIFRGVTEDGGATWAFTPLTWDSTLDNLRPVVPDWDEHHTALLWLRGEYRTYQDFDQAVVGFVWKGDGP